MSARENYYSQGLLRRPSNEDAGQKHRLDKKEAGQKQHWEGNKVAKYKVSFTDGTPSITVNARSPEEARAQFKEKKIRTIKKVK